MSLKELQHSQIRKTASIEGWEVQSTEVGEKLREWDIKGAEKGAAENGEFYMLQPQPPTEKLAWLSLNPYFKI